MPQDLQTQHRPQRPALTLPSELTIYTVADLRRDWLATVGVGGPLYGTRAASATGATPNADDGHDCTVDAAAVDQVDAAGVQLLLSLACTLAAAGRGLRLLHASAPLQRACQQMGISAALPGSHLDAATVQP